MTLQFSKKIDGKPTYFPEKINTGLAMEGYLEEELIFEGFNTELSHAPKYHTIREWNSRFKIGTKIHFKFWNEKPYKSKNINFAPIIPVKSVQNIEILQFIMTDSEKAVQLSDGTIYGIKIDGIRQTKSKIKKIIKNDGFDNEEAFFNHFKKFKGKLIHWTNLSY